jgi:hypothetical protein
MPLLQAMEQACGDIQARCSGKKRKRIRRDINLIAVFTVGWKKRVLRRICEVLTK